MDAGNPDSSTDVPHGNRPSDGLDSWRVELDSVLRADIRRLGDELGRTLLRQAGDALLAQVEQVRDLSRRADAGDDAASARLRAMLREVDTATAIRLVRAFTIYFHLATVAEQSHRISLLDSPEEAERGALPIAIDRLRRAGVDVAEVASVDASNPAKRRRLKPGQRVSPDGPCLARGLAL